MSDSAWFHVIFLVIFYKIFGFYFRPKPKIQKKISIQCNFSTNRVKKKSNLTYKPIKQENNINQYPDEYEMNIYPVNRIRGTTILSSGGTRPKIVGMPNYICYI